MLIRRLFELQGAKVEEKKNFKIFLHPHHHQFFRCRRWLIFGLLYGLTSRKRMNVSLIENRISKFLLVVFFWNFENWVYFEKFLNSKWLQNFLSAVYMILFYYIGIIRDQRWNRYRSGPVRPAGPTGLNRYRYRSGPEKRAATGTGTGTGPNSRPAKYRFKTGKTGTN